MSSSAGTLLPWIIAFKVLKTILLTALGVALLATRHDDPVTLLLRLALTFHLPMTSEWFHSALRFAAKLTVSREIALSATAFGYAALMGTEAVGLHLRKSWARWFTIVATSSLIPLEILEIARDPDAARVAILLANIIVVLYLFNRKEAFESG